MIGIPYLMLIQIEWHQPYTYEKIVSFTDAFLSPQSHLGRFRHLQDKIAIATFSFEQSILSSGFSVGFEMLAAKDFKVGEFHGDGSSSLFNLSNLRMYKTIH